MPPPKNTLVAVRPVSACLPREISAARVDVVVDEMAAIGPRREVAVVASVRAERHVDVHTEAHRAHLRARADVFPSQVTAALAYIGCVDATTPGDLSTVSPKPRTGPLVWKPTVRGEAPSTPAEIATG